MHIIYKISYLPHLHTEYPKYYIGSKYNYKIGYLGSVASKKKFDFTKDLSLKDWWKLKVKEEPENFLLEILENFVDISPNLLVEKELQTQKHFNIIGPEYFNQSYACGKFVSAKKDEEFKQNHSRVLKEWYKTDKGLEKRNKISEKNKEIKSKEMKDRWKNDKKFRNKSIERLKTPKSEKWKKNISLSLCNELEYKGNIYIGYQDLEIKTRVTKFLYKKYYLNGYDPEPNIGNKHPIKVNL